jgi:hypothetical protein
MVSGDSEMDRNAFQLRLLVVFFILALFVSPAPARTIDVGDSVCELVEADWIEQDQDQAENADFSLEYTNQLISRGYMLAKRLRALSASESRLEPLVTELRRLEARLADAASTAEERRGMYLDVRRTIRNIAFCNPLLDFDKILFIKRHDSVGVFHMCDQYYGCNAKPGGGLFVLSDPFGENPKLTNVLENSVVERGRLKGDSLSTGAFLSPELSYDGKTILFAYTQAKAYEKYRGKEAYEWGPEISYHIFKVNADGTGLVQLTDGDSDDFDPCYLPNGRIVFITERRGGYLATLYASASTRPTNGIPAWTTTACSSIRAGITSIAIRISPIIYGPVSPMADRPARSTATTPSGARRGRGWR